MTPRWSRRPAALAAVALVCGVAAGVSRAQIAAPADVVPQVDPWTPDATYDAAVPTVQAVLGFAPGERHATVDDIVAYARRLAQASDRVAVEEIGHSVEGDPLLLLVITDPTNSERLAARAADIVLLADPRHGDAAQRRAALAHTLPLTWIACSVHGDEASGADAGLQLAYQLAAGLDPTTGSVVENSVVIIDPCQNPDGRRRFTAHVRAFARALPEPDDTPAAAEHTQGWPGGRRNHYLFDLNRDWIYLTQPETNARVAAFRRWHPQVFVDLHEMGRESSYFFPPPADPINPYVSPQMRDWWDRFGRANAAAFDAHGYAYFVREAFDLFYPGYGDSWPTLQGAVGMTYEQGTTRGLRLRDASGEVLHYGDTVRRHFTAAWTTCVTAAKHGPALLESFERVAENALAAAKRGPVRALLVDPAVHPACARRLAQRLVKQGIEVLQTTAELQARVRPWGDESRTAAARRAFPPGTWIIPYDQPGYPLLRSLLDLEVPLDDHFVEQERARKQRGLDDRFYDVTAWSMILSSDVAAYTCAEVPAAAACPLQSDGSAASAAATDRPDTARAGAPAPAPPSAAGGSPIAWLFPYEDDTALAAACALLRNGVHVWICRDDAVHEGHKLPAGSFVVKAGSGADGELASKVAQAVTETGARVLSATRSWSEEGPSLGSARIAYMRPPRIAMVAGPGTRPESVGGIAWLLEQRMHYPYTTVFASSFDELRLSQLDAVLIPDLDVDRLELPLDALDAWVQAGGVMVAIGRAAAWLAAAREEWTSLEPVTDLRDLAEGSPASEATAGSAAIPDGATTAAPGAGKRSTAASPPGGIAVTGVKPRRERAAASEGAGESQAPIPLEDRPDRIPGAIGRVVLDPTHVLAFGQHDPELFVPILSERIFRPSVAGWNVGVYDARVRVAGFMWPDMEAALRGAAYLVDEPRGSGHLILFAEDPAFRGAWEGPSRLLLNALLLAPSLPR